MTLKTSFFNKAIYKSCVKRYAWGSFLYFVILFISTVLSVLLNIQRDFSYMPENYFTDYPVILHGQYITLPILMAIVVPTIVTLLIFRFIHSKKQTIFTHSLPVSKKANYISSLLAGFTLMYVPVLFNGLLLAITSLCGYSDYFTVANCLTWTGYNLTGIFMMFSIAVFSATVTGNSFASIVINILIHSVLFIIYASFNSMADVFLYGYNGGADEIFQILCDNNFTVVVYGFIDKYFRNDLTTFKYIIYSLISILIYIVSYFIYKKRKPETASDVAGFKSLNSVFKYLVSFLVTMFGFAIFSSYINNNITVFLVIIFFISLIAYFASEMVLKKTINVFYSWKGYIGFISIFILIVVIFAETSFFGFETNVPDKNDIESATLYNYYHSEKEPFTVNPEIIDIIINTHTNLVEKDFPKTKGSSLYQSEKMALIHIKYHLKNGKSIQRVYRIPTDDCMKLMNKLYSFDDYKKISEVVFIDDSLISNIYLNHEIHIKETYELLDVVREDVLNLTYEQLYNERFTNDEYSLVIEHKQKQPIEIKGMPQATATRREYIQINPSYEKTMKWLNEKGYLKQVKS